MAAPSQGFSLYSKSFHSRVPSKHSFQTSFRRNPFGLKVKACQNPKKEDILIVGAGIAGLATALSLHRLGIKSLVLEQAGSLRIGGTSMTLFKNGWRVLDTLGVADDLRRQFGEVTGMTIKTESGRELRSFQFKDEAFSQEVRGVERRVLLEMIARELPQDAICFSSRVSTIDKTMSGETLVVLDDGRQIPTKVLIGCDGVQSPVAKWMGFSEPRYVGQCAFRGLGEYQTGHSFEPKVNYIYGSGLRAGYVPLSSTKVYWFICFNNPFPGPRTSDPTLLKKEALQLVQSWPQELLDIIEKTPDEGVIKTPLVDRWLWPLVSPPGSAHGLALAGDAWHPMTPNLGQGACCALEDAIVLSRNLAKALEVNGFGGSSVDQALEAYTRERWGRVFPLAVRSNLVGSLLQWENGVGCFLRDNVVVPKLVRLGPLLEHTNYDCGTLQ
ncbi:hypothetical protein AMTRI_Chr03g52630 [Amborella trichopoda]|uniref:FAD-binding domain-containing protein n=1 Tax=Amborella trichopoda TaxID=13333 RepID=W1NZM1_AMBTC|nr:uncharacterized protein LOC18429200 [Amborella trichopoda]ERN01123.1 hypothetical protein AMTR_s00002p00203960 [Amborella trichopoda]|eukprot:XP_006838554.1 uncharacterized protein LOC18429200 [Amborella trichopoda]